MGLLFLNPSKLLPSTFTYGGKKDTITMWDRQISFRGSVWPQKSPLREPSPCNYSKRYQQVSPKTLFLQGLVSLWAGDLLLLCQVMGKFQPQNWKWNQHRNICVPYVAETRSLVIGKNPAALYTWCYFFTHQSSMGTEMDPHRADINPQWLSWLLTSRPLSFLWKC